MNKKKQLLFIACLLGCMIQLTYAQVTCVSLNCPGNVTVNATPGQCGAVVNYPLPTATDNFCQAPVSVPGYTYAGTFNSHTYFISTTQSKWSDAKAAAIAAGGKLASVNSAAEDAFLVSITGGQYVIVGGFQNHLNPNNSEPSGGMGMG